MSSTFAWEPEAGWNAARRRPTRLDGAVFLTGQSQTESTAPSLINSARESGHHRGGPVPYLAGLWCVEDVHGARLNAVGFGPLVKGKSAFPPTPISIW